MKAHTKQYNHIVLLFLLISCFLWNCSDKKEAMKAPIVSKKIAVQKVETPTKKKAFPEQSAAAAQPLEMAHSKVEELMGSSRIYDPEKRIDPFSPLFKTEKNVYEIEPEDVEASKEKRIPKTPLEKIGLDQLKLVATIRAPSGNKGLVEDSKGKGYIIKKGSYMGLHSGIVTHIHGDHVVIEEEIENLMGKRMLQNTEMKLQKPAGE